MSNPWSEAYKNFREDSLNEARKLRDVKTAATQGKYDLKSKVAKMRADGKSEMEIKQWLDKYLQNSKLPGEQKAQMRSGALQSEETELDEGLLGGLGIAAAAYGAYKAGQHLKKKGDEALDNARQNATLRGSPFGAGARQRAIEKAAGAKPGTLNPNMQRLRNSYEPEGEEVVSEGPEEYAGGQHPSKHPDKKVRDKYETQRRRAEAPKGVGVPDKSVGYGQLKQSFEPEGEIVDEQAYTDPKYAERPKGVPYKDLRGFTPSAFKDMKQYPAVYKGEKGMLSGDEGARGRSFRKDPEDYDRAVKQIERNKKSKPTSGRGAGRAAFNQNNSYEPEGGLVSEAEERVLVRITTEDGRVFEKKVPKDKIAELRQRYKSVVEVGSSDRKPQMTSKQGGDSVKEALDPVGKEDGDVNNDGKEDDTDDYLMNRRKVVGKAIAKKRGKKVKKESYSDWRSDMNLSEEGLGVSPREMRGGGEKKK